MSEVRLYIPWKQIELGHCVHNVMSSSFQELEQQVASRKYSMNIIDGGKDTRLKEVQDLLDNGLEQ